MFVPRVKATLGVPSSSSDAVNVATTVSTAASFSLNVGSATTSMVGPSSAPLMVIVMVSVSAPSA
ncbi:hypothetical protein AB6C62_10205, partial [Vibrio splendidus]